MHSYRACEFKKAKAYFCLKALNSYFNIGDLVWTQAATLTLRVNVSPVGQAGSSGVVNGGIGVGGVGKFETAICNRLIASVAMSGEVLVMDILMS
ncbi:hypothetical protein [Calothrix sp. UHCC 0171]|uniref:hypothetical protein n=1 Tax=Calothrix sp. UHCC 0171 TaxID=3110245 RepID=UPI002B21F161|nr:hypothetical protein [Calothrix sp. UHCC 0171]MEA5574796.1 hypothetical protein [Calothrix sp. UHCC 0171]